MYHKQEKKNWYQTGKAQAKKSVIVSDPDGMYTGRPFAHDEKPVQDADDL